MNILNKRNYSFTIIELLVVPAILAGVVIMLPNEVTGSKETALIQQAKVDMNGRVKTAILSYVGRKGVPTSSSAQLYTDITAISGELKDPWKTEYDFVYFPQM
jgi:type II secretory pathway pseudopilin PulG